MIDLFVEDYCHNCERFDPIADAYDYGGETYFFGNPVRDTLVTCKNRNLCKSIEEYIRKEMKERRK